MRREPLRILCLGLAGALLGSLWGAGAAADTIELSRDADLTVYGLHPSAQAGQTLACGDFDGDGQTDLAIGAPGGSPEFDPAQCPGIIYLLWGGTDVRGRAAAGLHKLPNRVAGTRNGQGIGSNVAAGDFDGDGRTDLLIGAPWTTEPGAPDTSGAAYLVLGRPRAEFPAILLLPDDADVVFIPDQPHVHLGEAVALGDWDGDGKADACLGAMYQNGFDSTRPHAGATYLFLGRERKKIVARLGVKGCDLAIHGGDRDDTEGRSLVLTDWNGDRRQDLVVGAYYGDGPFNTRDNPGEAYLVLGREAKALKGIKNRTLDLGIQGIATPIFGAWPYGATARATAGGDFDGDGFGDAAIGTYLGPSAPEDRFHCGIVDVVFGAFQSPQAIDLDSPPPLRVLGGYKYDQAGRPLAAGDLDGDDRDELLIGATYADPIGPDSLPRLQAGMVGIVKGRPRGDTPRTLDVAHEPFDHVLHGIDPEDQCPSAMAVLDLDGDGKADLVIGAAQTSGRENAMLFAGEVYFLLGAGRSW